MKNILEGIIVTMLYLGIGVIVGGMLAIVFDKSNDIVFGVGGVMCLLSASLYAYYIIRYRKSKEKKEV